MLSRNDQLTTGGNRQQRARGTVRVNEPAHAFFVTGSSLDQMNGMYVRRNPPRRKADDAGKSWPALYYEHEEGLWHMALNELSKKAKQGGHGNDDDDDDDDMEYDYYTGRYKKKEPTHEWVFLDSFQVHPAPLGCTRHASFPCVLTLFPPLPCRRCTESRRCAPSSPHTQAPQPTLSVPLGASWSTWPHTQVPSSTHPSHVPALQERFRHDGDTIVPGAGTWQKHKHRLLPWYAPLLTPFVQHHRPRGRHAVEAQACECCGRCCGRCRCWCCDGR